MWTRNSTGVSRCVLTIHPGFVPGPRYDTGWKRLHPPRSGGDGG